MDYYGLLFLYYLKGLSGKSVLRLFFNIEAGGTEQLLPENTSTPTTTPILADIQYPDGLRTDQYFTYRETPTTVSNKARIKTIKGNTLVWNQLVQNGNFADTTGTGFGVIQGTVSYANNTATVVPNEPTDRPVFRVNQNISVANHKMLLMAETSEQIITFVAYTSGWTEIVATNDIIRVGNRNFIFFTPSSATSIHYLRFNSGLTSIAIKNVMCFDLTQMGLNITEPSEFVSLFSLPYYAYNAGTLLSFNGNGIKTVGKNLIDWKVNVTASACVINNPIPTTYILSAEEAVGNGNWYIRCDDGSETYPYTQAQLGLSGWQKTSSGWVYGGGSLQAFTFIIPIGCTKIEIGKAGTNGTINAQLEFGSTATDFEPYTSSTLPLPISTYFPSGMKSAGSVYDELTPAKAITRIGAVDLGSLTWNYNSSSAYFTTNDISSLYKVPTSNLTVANIIDPKHTSISANDLVSGGQLGIAIRSNGTLMVKDTNYTDATAFKTAMSGVYLYYELAEYQETPITTEDANEALSLLMGKSVSSNNANQLIDIITKGE